MLAQIPTTFIHTLLNLDHLLVGLHKYDPGLWLSKEPPESTLLKNKGLVFTSILGTIRTNIPYRWKWYVEGVGHKFCGLEPKRKPHFYLQIPFPTFDWFCVLTRNLSKY